jgi:hypothetical protein
MVSEQQKLCQQQPAKAQTCPDAPLDGPQSRLAPIELTTDSSCLRDVDKYTRALLDFCVFVFDADNLHLVYWTSATIGKAGGRTTAILLARLQEEEGSRRRNRI